MVMNAEAKIVESALTRIWDHEVVLSKCRPYKKKRLLRCMAESHPSGIPTEFLVKLPRSSTSEGFDSETDVPETPIWKARNEAAALTFLADCLQESFPSPRLLGFDEDSGIMAFEFIQRVKTFRDLMRAQSKDLEDAFVAYARTMASVHGMTYGMYDSWSAIRYGETRLPCLTAHGRKQDSLSGAVMSELDEISDTLSQTNVMSLLHIDRAPQNYLWGKHGIALVDFEYSTFGICPLDFAIRRSPFNDHRWSLPDEVVTKCETEYETHFISVTGITKERFRILHLMAQVDNLLRQLPKSTARLTSLTEIATIKIREVAASCRNFGLYPGVAAWLVDQTKEV